VLCQVRLNISAKKKTKKRAAKTSSPPNPAAVHLDFTEGRLMEFY
jgi:hypothetical protein